MVAEIAVVTPCLDAAETLDRTVHSVVAQAGNFRIRYHVQDGGSADGTLRLLAAWERRLSSGDFPVHCAGIRFSYASGADGGRHDALVRGFGGLKGPGDQFLTWIEAGDLLLPGALALVAAAHRQFVARELSWLGGMAAALGEDLNITMEDRVLPVRAIRSGLCDGTHWAPVPQPGTFFRRWLWDAAGAGQADDWALWRAFAQKASLVQAMVPLGARGPGHGGVRAGVDAALPVEARQAALKALLNRPDLRRRTLRGAPPDAALEIYEEPAFDQAISLNRRLFGLSPREPANTAALAPVLVARGRDGAEAAQNPHQLRPGIMGVNADWQYPAITEQHAFERLSAHQTDLPEGVLYVAFPWATLIDKLKKRAPDADAMVRRFDAMCAALPAGRRKVTVCQHIFARQYERLFLQAGIADVFWSHATGADVARAADGTAGVRFHPFPLYPVQTPEALPEASPEADAARRRYLFSFVGARATKYYLTQARNWILDLLANDPRGLVRGRDAWHYQRVVYDLQVSQTAPGADSAALVDAAAAAEFRDGLVNSTFALCPSGSGPNSIRLWEALAAGSVPVIMADSWAPPGDRRLWDLAAVFCPETPEAIRALPDRLAAIAAEPGRLAQMRHAMRQLWLLYGVPAFVTDVVGALLARGQDDAAHQPLRAADLPVQAAPAPTPAPQEPADTDEAARALLLGWSGRLLVEPAAALDDLAATPDLAARLAAARQHPAADGVRAHFDAVMERALKRAGRSMPVLVPAGDPPRPDAAAGRAPAARRAPVPRVCLFGRHAHRTPMAYAPFRRLIGDRIAWTQSPAEADLIVAGFDQDFRENAANLHALTGAGGGPRLAVFSEEPLWDITWSGAPEGRRSRLAQDGITLDYAYLAHGSSEIFSFRALPYYLLTEDRFIARYASLIARQAQRSPAALLDHWRAAPVRAAFLAERRTGEKYRSDTAEGQIVKLSAYRTDLAERMQAKGALCLGKGWTDTARRQDLPDWHLDKLALLHDRCFLMGAQENMHHGLYVSEKIFDAFACGALPIYFAGPAHRVLDLVPEAAMVNTYGLQPEAAAARLAALTPEAATAAAWLDTCRHLAALFADLPAVDRERTRVADAVVAEVHRLV